MVTFGGTTLPNVQAVVLMFKRWFVEKPIPGREVAFRDDLGGAGGDIKIVGIITASQIATMQTLLALADGTPRTLDFELDGADTYTCLMIDPKFNIFPVGAPTDIPYSMVFKEQDNP